MFLDLLNENTELLVEATEIGIEPSMVGIHEINEAMIQESHELEASLMYTSTKIMINEGVTLQEGVKKVFGNVFAKMKSIVLKMWAKIKEFFGNLKLFFNKFIMKGNKFADTYEDEIKGISSVSVEGYEFAPEAIDIKSIWSGMQSKAQAVTGDDKSETVLDQMSQAAVSQPAKSFKLGCQTKLKWTGKPIQVTYSGSALMSLLKGLNSSLNTVSADASNVDAAYKATVACLDVAISANQKEQSESKDGTDEAKSASDAGKVLTTKCSLLKSALGLVNVAAGMKAGALKAQAAQAQKAAYKGIAESRKSSK